MVNRPAPTRSRTRRSVEEARRLILDAAQRRLIAGGPEAVRVQTVAADVGITDAAVHYHFANREGLMEALLAEAGRRLRRDLRSVANDWDVGSLDLDELARRFREIIDTEGHGRLTAWMTLNGWRPHGQGGLRRLADTIQEHRLAGSSDPTSAPTLEDTQFCVELLALVVWAEVLVGDAWRRAVGLPTDKAIADRFMAWFTALLEAHLLGPGSRRRRASRSEPAGLSPRTAESSTVAQPQPPVPGYSI